MSPLLCSDLLGQVSCEGCPLKQLVFIANAWLKGLKEARTAACASVSLSPRCAVCPALGECSIIVCTDANQLSIILCAVQVATSSFHMKRNKLMLAVGPKLERVSDSPRELVATGC